MRCLLVAVLLLGSISPFARAQADLNDQLEAMTHEAVRVAAPSVVQIITQGGSDLIVNTAKGQSFRKALGPTTGVIVGEDGYVISSAFNFLNNPTTILVAVPGKGDPVVARRVATDHARMLTLLKVEMNGLPVPASVPKGEVREGQWAVALGRTLEAKKHDGPPSVSVGIVSALGRIWGKAIQTDAKVSPINYGGPLVDLRGRVQGILIPASPEGDDEKAAFEWYDSGVGFAVPMDDVQAVLPRLKQGKDLHAGLLGVFQKPAMVKNPFGPPAPVKDIYGVRPEIGGVADGSAAMKAGLKPGDILTEVDGKPVTRMAQVLHALGRKYEGDKIALKYERGGKEFAVAELTLTGKSQQVVAQPFLGILPVRDDPKLGVEVRYVFAKGPAVKAGLKQGDRILQLSDATGTLKPFTGDKRGRAALYDWLNTRAVGGIATIEVERKEGAKKETLTVTLDPLPGTVPGSGEELPDKLPEPASRGKALEPLETANKNAKAEKPAPPPKDAETGFLKRNTPDGEHKYWLYVPENYDPNVAHALVVWLHPPGKTKDEDGENFADLWAEYCEKYHLILVGPLSQNDGGWVASEAEFIKSAVDETLSKYTIDRQRIIAHGLGVGGQMALYLGFHHRDLFRGVAVVGAVATQVKDNTPAERLAFFLAVGALDPLAKSVAESRTKLMEQKYSVVFREIANRGREYLEEPQLRELARWIDSLDRQ